MRLGWHEDRGLVDYIIYKEILGLRAPCLPSATHHLPTQNPHFSPQSPVSLTMLAAARNATSALKHSVEHIEHAASSMNGMSHAHGHLPHGLPHEPMHIDSRPGMARSYATHVYTDLFAKPGEDIHHLAPPRMTDNYHVDVHGMPISPEGPPSTPLMRSTSRLSGGGMLSPRSPRSSILEQHSPIMEIPGHHVSVQLSEQLVPFH